MVMHPIHYGNWINERGELAAVSPAAPTVWLHNGALQEEHPSETALRIATKDREPGSIKPQRSSAEHRSVTVSIHRIMSRLPTK